ncbi:14504_t:CDS:1, partial [Funneliformis caledonium]
MNKPLPFLLRSIHCSSNPIKQGGIGGISDVEDVPSKVLFKEISSEYCSRL